MQRAENSFIYKLIKRWVDKKHKAYSVMVDTTRDCVVDPSLITSPFLNMNSEQEIVESPQFKEFTEVTREKASNPLNKFEVMPANEGADSHAIGTNLSLMTQILFDWFEEVLRNY